MSTLPQEGTPAPAFSLPDEKGTVRTLEEFQGQWLVLYFYPEDDTPGCTKEACGFRDASSALAKANVTVLGVSANDGVSHQKFIEKYHLNFSLLADTDRRAIDAYGVYKTSDGTQTTGIRRTTFLIGPTGTIAKVFENVKPEGHEQQILAEIGKR